MGRTALTRELRKKTETPQSEPIPGSTQVANSAGGYSFEVDDWMKLQRFLILGTEGGTYYVKESKLTSDNTAALGRCIDADYVRAIDLIEKISVEGRAVKNDQALFALSVAASHEKTHVRQYAMSKLSRVARTGTHLLHFADFINQQRGWGPLLRRHVGAWFTEKSPDQLAYQAVKYAQRDGWSLSDLLRLSHPKTTNTTMNSLLRYIVDGEIVDAPPRLIYGVVELRGTQDSTQAAKLIRDYRIPREAVPTQFLNSTEVWEALLEDMPMTALIRNLPTLTRNGLLAPMGGGKTREIIQQLGDAERIKKARVHPMQVLVALSTYKLGRSLKGSSTWTPVKEIINALDAAFYTSFGNVEPANKRTMLALDVSGSMGATFGESPLSCREASAAMAMVTEKVEPYTIITGFRQDLTVLDISSRQRLDDIVRSIAHVDFGTTDCSQPMLYALEKNLDIDTFIVYTDNETWAGKMHPPQALQKYRKHTGIPAKLIVVSMTANPFSIADPNDAGMMDVIGFDTSVPQVMSDFSRGI